MKSNACKVRRLYKDKVIAGFAGALQMPLPYLSALKLLEVHQGHLVRSAVELAKDWRTDKMLRRLEAVLAVADAKTSLIITGNGDVIEPEEGLIAIGSGGPYAQAAAKALIDNTTLSAEEIVQKSLMIAGHICIYTNHHLTIESLDNLA